MEAKSNRVNESPKAEDSRVFLCEDASTLRYFDGVHGSDASMLNYSGDVRAISTDDVTPTIDLREAGDIRLRCETHYKLSPIRADSAPWHETGYHGEVLDRSIPTLMNWTDSQLPMSLPFPSYPHEESPIAGANDRVNVPKVTPESSAALTEDPVELINFPTQFPSYDSMGMKSLQHRWSNEPGRGCEISSQESIGQRSARIDNAPFSIPRRRLQYLMADEALNPPHHSELLSETPVPTWGSPSNEVHQAPQVEFPALRNQHALVQRQDENPKDDPLYFLEAVQNEAVDQHLGLVAQAYFGDRSTFTILAAVSPAEKVDANSQVQQGTLHPISAALVESKRLPCETLIGGSEEPVGSEKSKQLPVVRLGRGKSIYNRASNVHYRGAVHSMSTEYKNSPARSNRKKKIVMDIIGNYQFEFQDKNGHWEEVTCPRFLKKKVQLDLRKV